MQVCSRIVTKYQNNFKTEAVVVKAQIHAGGRGKAGGVKLVKRPKILEEAKKHIPENIECEIFQTVEEE